MNILSRRGVSTSNGRSRGIQEAVPSHALTLSDALAARDATSLGE